MKTTISEMDGKIIARLDGELDTAAAVHTEKEFQPLLDSKDKDITLECSGLRYISSSGLRLFLSLLKSAKANGCNLTLENLNDNIMKVFNMTGFSALFNIK